MRIPLKWEESLGDIWITKKNKNRNKIKCVNQMLCHHLATCNPLFWFQCHDNPLSPNKRYHWCLECFELDRICKPRIERYGGAIIEYIEGFCEIVESCENLDLCHDSIFFRNFLDHFIQTKESNICIK